MAELPPLPAAVEVAAYRIVTEAVTNVVRHAGATRCDVRVAVDGPAAVGSRSATTAAASSTEPPATGNGLQTMRERPTELRGRLRVTGQARHDRRRRAAAARCHPCAAVAASGAG